LRFQEAWLVKDDRIHPKIPIIHRNTHPPTHPPPFHIGCPRPSMRGAPGAGSKAAVLAALGAVASGRPALAPSVAAGVMPGASPGTLSPLNLPY